MSISSSNPSTSAIGSITRARTSQSVDPTLITNRCGVAGEPATIGSAFVKPAGLVVAFIVAVAPVSGRTMLIADATLPCTTRANRNRWGLGK